MILLHAALIAERLFVWGEAPPAPDPPAPRPRRPARHRLPEPNPYDAGSAHLQSALREAGLDFGRGSPTTERLVAWLPTGAGAPFPSSPLVAEVAVDPGRARVAPWRVTGLVLSGAESVQLLSSCVGRETLANGVAVSKDLAFWTVALRFAGALVARNRFLPGMAEAKGTWVAAWTPVLEASDAERIERLAAAMPAACRSVSRERNAPPSVSAESCLRVFIAETVDQLVRMAAGPQGGRPSAESAHDAWLEGLRARKGLLAGSPPDLGRLADEVQEWRRPVAVSAVAPFRLCFRLEEPPLAAASPWLVQYLLQGTRDPSLLVPAESAWNGDDTGQLFRSSELREYLLGSLGQAAALCPPVEESLRHPAPAGYLTDAGGAHAFLTESAAALGQAGFGVLLPAWWTGKGTKQRLAARAEVRAPKMAGSGSLGMEDLVRFEWRVALGGEDLTLAELQALARLKAPLVQVRGQWVHVTPAEVEAALALWRKKGGEASVREMVHLALGATQPVESLTFEGITATGWVAELLARLQGHAGFEEIPSPRGLNGTLRPYQRRGYSWLAFLRRFSLGACLADDMGLGKTIQTLALLLEARAAKGTPPALLVCPTSVMGNWEKEAQRFTPRLSVLVHHGLSREKGRAFEKAARKSALVVTSYALLHRDLEHFQGVRWSAVILDEAQNIKNPETKQARAARALVAGHRIALTGTPVENNVGDLWSLMEFLNPGLLGTQADFKRRYFVPIQAGQDPGALERLRRLTGPFILRRLKTDRTVIKDLPEKMEMKVYCTLTREQASLYAAVVRDAEEALEDAEGIKRKGLVLATLSKLKQVCNHPAQFLGDNSPVPGRSGKLARLTEMIEETLEAGDRTLVFSQFAEMGEILRGHLQDTFGREVLFLHGGVPKRGRDRMIERFQAEEAGPAVFILSLKAGGTGLNLTRASHVFHFDRWWNPAVENQATDRAFRIGQTRRVQVHKLVCRGTLEEKIDEMIEGKKALAERVVGAGEGWLTKLSTSELKQLFALGSEAVGE
jgi:superfamily II DNA or RNA helicase